MKLHEEISVLVEEYRSLVIDANKNEAPNSLQESLIRKGDWSPEAARLLIDLSKNYGYFVLRNALALALALDVEDGELGL